MQIQQQRAQALREEKLALIREQVANGSLVIRQMTPNERASYRPERRRQAGR
jgi:hypothetical protein